MQSLIFRHNLTQESDRFLNDDEARDANSSNKYSILGKIEREQKKYLIDGMFEFILEYPEIEGCNHWKQKLFPTQANHSVENGFIDLGSTYSDNYWRGLSLSNCNDCSYIDGSPFDNTWFFPIGQKDSYQKQYCIPDPIYEQGTSKYPCVSDIKLYIRCPENTCKNMFKLKIISSIFIYLFCIPFLS